MSKHVTRAAGGAIMAALLMLATSAGAQRVEITDAWVRATVPGQKVAAAYLTARASAAAKLVEVKTKSARRAEIHSMTHEGGVMRMRRLESLDLPAGQAVALEPGGNHIMLFDLVKPLKVGQQVSLTLVIEQDGKRIEQVVPAPVRSPDATEPAHQHH